MRHPELPKITTYLPLFWRPGYGSIGTGCPGYTGGARSCLGVTALRRPLRVLHGVAGASLQASGAATMW